MMVWSSDESVNYPRYVKLEFKSEFPASQSSYSNGLIDFDFSMAPKLSEHTHIIVVVVVHTHPSPATNVQFTR